MLTYIAVKESGWLSKQIEKATELTMANIWSYALVTVTCACRRHVSLGHEIHPISKKTIQSLLNIWVSVDNLSGQPFNKTASKLAILPSVQALPELQERAGRKSGQQSECMMNWRCCTDDCGLPVWSFHMASKIQFQQFLGLQERLLSWK